MGTAQTPMEAKVMTIAVIVLKRVRLRFLAKQLEKWLTSALPFWQGMVYSQTKKLQENTCKNICRRSKGGKRHNQISGLAFGIS